MTSPQRRFPFGHDPAPPRDINELPARHTEPLGLPGYARITEPLPLPDPPRMTAPILVWTRRNTLPFRRAPPRRSPVLLPARPGIRALRLGWVVAISACILAVAVAVLVVVTIAWRGR